MENYLLAVDIGTTSTKGMAIRTDGEVLVTVQKEYPTHYTPAGFAEQDPHQIFEAIIAVISETAQRVGHAPAGVTFSGAMHGLMAVDQSGTPLTGLMTWADTRSAEQASMLRSTPQGTQIYRRTGTPIHPMSPLCKLIWMKEQQPEIFRTAAKFISAKEYLFANLFGEYVIDYSIASASGLFDIHTLNWSTDALGLLGLDPSRLSRPVSPYFSCSGMTELFARRLSIPRGTPFVAGANDGCLAHLGCGAMQPGDLSVTIGTSGAVRMASPAYFEDKLSRIFNYRLDEKTFVAGGATNNGAVLLSWFDENIERKVPDGASFVDEAFSIPGSEGLIFCHSCSGERAPMYDPHAKGVFMGIHIQHTRAHFKRAILEGICFELKSIARAVEEVVHPISRVIASGGFVKSDQWVQLLADVLGKTVTVNSQSDASSLGAALQGFQSLGIRSSFQEQRGRSFIPDASHHRQYQRIFEIVDPMYDKLKGDFAKLARLGAQQHREDSEE